MSLSRSSLKIHIFCRESASCYLTKQGQAFGFSSLKYRNQHSQSLSLSEKLKARIEVRGPLTVAEYMRAVLTNASEGYYMHRDVLGRQGDFTTSPEITQLIGDMVGIWFVNEVKKFYAPTQPLQLIELGPGRGSLTMDVLKVFKQLRGKDGLSVHLVEISPEFSRIQAEKLCLKSTIQRGSAFLLESEPKKKENRRHYSIGKDTAPDNLSRKDSSFGAVTVRRPENLPKKSDPKYYQTGLMEDGTPVFWYYSLNEVPRNFSCILAHEFFDALPIHKFKKTPEGWREILVTTDPDKGPETFKFIISRAGTPSSKVFMKPWDTRQEAEISPETGLIAQQIATRLEENGGVALIVDYGGIEESCDTFRAFRKHKQVDPLVSPGTADLTADVDFVYLQNSVKDKAITWGPVAQATFLKEMGIETRLKILLEKCPEDQKSHLLSGYNMIMNKMGERFKFFAIFPNVLEACLKKNPVSGFSKR